MKTKRCPRGMIRRNAYTRKTTHVPSACIKDVGLPGKGFRGEGSGIGELREGELSRFGYDKVATMSAKDRHAALTNAVKEYGALMVFRKLNAISIYTRYTAPESSRIFLRDRNWVKRTFGNTKND